MKVKLIILLVLVLVFVSVFPAVASGDKNHGPTENGDGPMYANGIETCPPDIYYQRCKPTSSP